MRWFRESTDIMLTVLLACVGMLCSQFIHDPLGLQGAWIIALSILGGSAIAAGGSLGSAAMMGGNQQEPFSQGIYNPNASNPMGVGQYWLSALMGLYDPSLLNQAGPLDSALAQFRTAPYPPGAGRSGQERVSIRVEALKSYYAKYQESRDRGASPELALSDVNATWAGMAREAWPFSGYNSLGELFTAEYEHQQRIDEIGILGEQLSGVSRQSIVNYINKTSEIMADLPGMDQGEIDEYKAAELARINQELDQQVQQAQRRANVGGYNPGREIEEIERRRQDADSVALERALALIQGEQGVAGTSMGLLQSGSNLFNNISLAGSLSQAGTPTLMGGGQIAPNTTAQQAAYLSDAASSLGSGIGNAGLAYGMGNAPGYTPSVGFTPTTPQQDFPSLYR